MSFSDYVRILKRVEENAEDFTFDQFMLIMKFTSDSREFYEILEAHPEYVNQQDKDGKTALILAAERGMGDVVETLIVSHDADIFIKDKAGKMAAEYFKQYYEEDPEAMEELGVDGMKYYKKVFEQAARKKAKDSAGLNIVSRQRQMGDLSGPKGLPPELIAKVSEFGTGVTGSLAKQQGTLGKAVGKGRKRKTRRARKTRRRT